MTAVDGLPVDYTGLPSQLRGGMRRYIEDGIKPGDCLTAILQDRLMDTVLRMHPGDLSDLPEIVRWLHWQAPGQCHGSREKVKAWVEMRRQKLEEA